MRIAFQMNSNELKLITQGHVKMSIFVQILSSLINTNNILSWTRIESLIDTCLHIKYCLRIFTSVTLIFSFSHKTNDFVNGFTIGN